MSNITIVEGPVTDITVTTDSNDISIIAVERGPLTSLTKSYVDAADNTKVAKAGDTMTGPLAVEQVIDPVGTNFVTAGPVGGPAVMALSVAEPYPGLLLGVLAIASYDVNGDPLYTSVVVVPPVFTGADAPRIGFINRANFATLNFQTGTATADDDAIPKHDLDAALAAKQTEIDTLNTTVATLSATVATLDTTPKAVVPTGDFGTDQDGAILIPKTADYALCVVRPMSNLDITFENPGSGWVYQLILQLQSDTGAGGTAFLLNGASQFMAPGGDQLWNVFVQGTGVTDPVVTTNRIAFAVSN